MRASGILMPISSLPSPYGIGTMGAAARSFVDFLVKSGQAYWQILPVCPTSYGDSPYQSFSTFAGNPYFIDLDDLAKQGLLLPEEYASIDWECAPDCINYGVMYEKRYAVLRCAAKRLLAKPGADYRRFVKENDFWLPDYALFMALKDAHNGACWLEWEEPLRRREPAALAAAREQYADDVAFWQAVQFMFYSQWQALKHYANRQEIRIIGDLPIYVAMDSADVWAEPEMFQLDEHNVPTEVSGVPPDCFSEDGQLWGNPLYNYEAMAKDGFGWWIRRIGGAQKLYDVIRIDHFRGFESYWAIPYGETTAKNGRWVKGPGMSLVGVLTGWFRDLDFIAEDLGYPSPEVVQLLSDSGLPGMKVLEFAFDSRDPSDYLPHSCNFNSICYTGTHDNAPLALWRTEADKADIAFAKKYLGLNDEEGFNAGIIRGGMSCQSRLFVAQMQDYLGLGKGCRMNTPGTSSGNWQWRMLSGEASKKLAKSIHETTRIYGRL